MTSEPDKLKKPCPRCGGTGQVWNSFRLGVDLAKRRVKAGLTGREVAKEMGISPQYLSDLEKGRRSWTEPLRARYLVAMETITVLGKGSLSVETIV